MSDRPEDLWAVDAAPEAADHPVAVVLGRNARAKARRTVDKRFNALALSAGPQLFVDWRFVQAGRLHWTDRESGAVHALHIPDAAGAVDARAVRIDVPAGVRLAAQPACKSEPLAGGADRPTPSATIFHHEGRYLSWGRRAGSDDDGKDVTALALLESEDGLEWREVGPLRFDLSANPEAQHPGESGYFIDPHAPDDERFKMIFRASPRGPEHAAFRARILEEHGRTRPDDIDAVVATYRGKFSAMYGAVSADGMHWTARKGPLIIQFSDTRNVVEWDEALQRYVWYERNNWNYGRRCIGRSESPTFDSFPAPQMLVTPGLDDDPADDWYTNSKTRYPGTADYHFMFPARYNRRSEECDLCVYSSPDGIVWARVPPGPVLATGAPGAWDGGCIFGGVALVPLSGDRVGLPYSGYDMPHKYPRNRHTIRWGTAYATWSRERIVALEAPYEGAFATHPMLPAGETGRLRLNVQTRRAGEVLVELADQDGTPLPGYGFADADPVTGDLTDHHCTWRGSPRLPHRSGQSLTLRFRLCQAKLFAFELLP